MIVKCIISTGWEALVLSGTRESSQARKWVSSGQAQHR
jgi:hypothetical protein